MRRSVGVGPEERRADRLGQTQADRAADEGAEQIGDLSRPQPRLDPDDQQRRARRRSRGSAPYRR